MPNQYESLLTLEAQAAELQRDIEGLFNCCFKCLGDRMELQKKDFNKYYGAKYQISKCTKIGDFYQTRSSIYERIA